MRYFLVKGGVGHLKILVQKGGGGRVNYYSGEKFDM